MCIRDSCFVMSGAYAVHVLPHRTNVIILPLIVMETFRMERVGSITGTLPVSYTHLDVYKRQSLVFQFHRVHCRDSAQIITPFVREMCIRDRAS